MFYSLRKKLSVNTFFLLKNLPGNKCPIVENLFLVPVFFIIIL